MCYVHNQCYDISCATLYLMRVENKRKGREGALGYIKVYNIWTFAW